MSRWRDGPLARRLKAAPLGVKLALVSAVLTIAVVVITFALLRARTGREVRRVFTDELVASQRGLRQLQNRNLRLLLATSALLSTSPTLRAALETYRSESNAGQPRPDLLPTIQREVQRVFDELDRDLLVVTDDRGRVLAAAGEGAPAAGTDLNRLPAVHHILEGTGAAADSGFGVVTAAGTPLQVGCVAIVLQGFPIGVLVLGERLDRLLPSLDSAMGTRSFVTAGDEVLVSSLAAIPAGARHARAADAAERLQLGGEEYVVATLSLGSTDDGRPAELHLARSLSALLGPLTGSLGRGFLIAGLVAVLLAVGGAVFLSRTTLRPLDRFVRFMRSGRESGSFAQFQEAHAPAEIATLTDAYNQLIDNLGKQHSQLEERTVQLASVNESLIEEARERERAEQALKESEEQLRQSQKLEALGTLAGGVAHDFNNLLSVIIGYAQLTAMEVPAGSPLKDDLAQISQAADRASVLVKQLLAFGRKQVLQPRIVDLNQIVTGMETMLRRLIGEDIEVQIRLSPRLERITADPGQLEQVLMNLVVNARDAMPTGGTLLVETANTRLDEKYEHRPDSISAGPAVMLSVTDTGMGMDGETRRRIFEPFFTTKAPGKGTGLGLSMVYGIVRQSGGSITVYSEPGKGTTFRTYFPPAREAPTSAEAEVFATTPSGGTETVLVAEDDPQLRSLVRRCLTARGYVVLEASHGAEALEMAQDHQGPIHLLLTDVVMPYLSGKELAEQLRAARPETRVLFVSGHSDEAIERHGLLAPESAFLQKPVDPDALLRVVRDILDAEPVGNG